MHLASITRRCLLGGRILALCVGGFGLQACTDDDDEVMISSRSYQGHANDADINAFVATYPHTVGTRLDDCQTCHKGGTVLDDELEGVTANPCDYCHFIIHPPADWTDLPQSFAETLNPYGTAFRDAGRDAEAVAAIAGQDSDGDGHLNSVEIADLRYPGDAGSHPGLALAPVVTFTMDEIQALPPHTQFGLANASKQQFDYYATYTGVRIAVLLEAAGVDLAGATSVDVMAPDGYARSFTLAEITQPFPAHRFFAGFGVADLGANCAFVEYPANTYSYASGDLITDEQWHILAYAREGVPLETAYLDPVTARIIGEGPFRNVIPPGAADDALNQPDRGQNWDASGCTLPEWNYQSMKSHNAGSMVKAAMILRINPMPDGYEEFDIQNGGWAMVDAGHILIYGHGVE